MRALLWLSGVVVIAAAFLGAGRIWAEDDDNKPAVPRTRIAVFNLTYVLKNYRKYKTLQDDLKEIAEPFKNREALLRKKLEKLRAEVEEVFLELNAEKEFAEQLKKEKAIDAQLRKKLEKLRVEAEALANESSNKKESAEQLRKKLDTLEQQAKQVQREMEDNSIDSYKGRGKNPAELLREKDALERQAKQLQRQLEDNTAELKLKRGLKSDEEMKVLFRDVYEAVKHYAPSHGFDVVLHYNDPISKEDNAAESIVRKRNTGGLIVATSTTGLDVSKDIVDLLNSGSRQKP